MTRDELLAGLAETLDTLADLVTLGRRRYDTDPLVRLAMQRLWITVGNYAEAFRAAAGLPSGVQPWSEMYGYRSILAHMLPHEISDDRVSASWHDNRPDREMTLLRHRAASATA